MKQHTSEYEPAFYAQLKAEIAGAGFSIKQLAETLGVDYTTLTKRLNGKLGLDMQLLLRILEAIGVSLGDFGVAVTARHNRES